MSVVAGDPALCGAGTPLGGGLKLIKAVTICSLTNGRQAAEPGRLREANARPQIAQGTDGPPPLDHGVVDRARESSNPPVASEPRRAMTARRDPTQLVEEL
jgi:hypothetical protein